MYTKYQNILKSFENYLASKGKTPHTIRSYHTDVVKFLEYLTHNNYNLQNISYDLMIQYQDYLNYQKKDKINTIRRETLGLKQFFKFILEKSITSVFPFEKVPIPSRQDDIPQHFNYELIDKILMKYIKLTSTIKELRNACILVCLGYEGIKISELINLSWKDLIINNQNATLNIRGYRQRVISLNQTTSDLLNKYFIAYKEQLCPYIKQPIENCKIFVSFKGKDTFVPNLHMGRHGVKFVLYEIGTRFQFEYFNSELLRHYCIERMIRNNMSSEYIMQHLGLRQEGNIAKHRVLLSKNIDEAIM